VKQSAAVVITALALGVATPALAEEGPTLDVYGGEVGALQVPVAKQGGGPPSPPSVPSAQAASSQTGTLPFTGLELGVFALVGGALVGTGVGLRRLTRAIEG
jgi:hypothetical protein